ncbi:MAG: hypothetical protein ACYDDF_07295 [Thermoplasmatota archaeon]
MRAIWVSAMLAASGCLSLVPGSPGQVQSEANGVILNVQMTSPIISANVSGWASFAEVRLKSGVPSRRRLWNGLQYNASDDPRATAWPVAPGNYTVDVGFGAFVGGPAVAHLTFPVIVEPPRT